MARIERSFEAQGIKTVILRAGAAEKAKTITAQADGAIRISGKPAGGAEDYQSPDPSWKETPASEWGLDFKSQRFGDVLVISTVNEIVYIHHHYTIEDLELTVPAKVTVKLETRALNGDGDPDLSQPGKPRPRHAERTLPYG